ncbi:hypothetical protein Tco_0800077 [Tanacetum coccineum]|uniref:Reverse transcriptase domain-containing protein n=1 Tax=Tanacetum coccineum TaxID=301880 RepID=A0ABQ4ZS46_9ASTR
MVVQKLHQLDTFFNALNSMIKTSLNSDRRCVVETKSSFDEPPEVELKDLPPHLEYAFLEGDDKLPVIIAKDLKDEEKAALIKVLKSHKRAIAWKLSDNSKVFDPEFCTHKIRMKRTTNQQFRVKDGICADQVIRRCVSGQELLTFSKLATVDPQGDTTDFPDCEDSRARSIHMSFTSSASFWESSIQI